MPSVILRPTQPWGNVVQLGNKTYPGPLHRRRVDPVDPLWVLAGSAPAVDFDFSSDSMLDKVSDSDLITYTRPSTAWGWNGSQFVEFANDVPRIVVDPATGLRGLLVEEARTNTIRNSAMAGAVVGSPGTLPTNWSQGQNTGLEWNVVGTGIESGINYIDIRVDGTSAGAGQLNLVIDLSRTAATAQTWTLSSFITLVAGSLDGITKVLYVINERTSGNAFVANKALIITGSIAAGALGQNRISFSTTLDGGGTVANIRPRIQLNIPASTAISATLRIGLPQLELGAFPTSPIITTGSALTRSADTAVVTGANFSSWFNASAGALRVEHVVGRTVSSAVGIVGIDDSTNSNRINLWHRTPGSTGCGVATAGVSQADSTPATPAPAANTHQRHAFAFASDSFNVSYNGNIGGDTTSLVVPVVNRLAIGFTTTAGGSLSGIIPRITIWPTRLPNVTLQALTA